MIINNKALLLKNIYSYLIFLLFFISPLISIGQVTVTAQLTTPDEVESKHFVPTTIKLKDGRQLKGYGTPGLPLLENVWFLTEKPQEEKVKSVMWKAVYAKNDSIEKIELTYSQEKLILLPIKLNSTIFLQKVYRNNSLSLYKHMDDRLYYGFYYLIYNGEKKAHKLILNHTKPDKSIKKKNSKKFKGCLKLQLKIEEGVYKNTLEDLISALDFYDQHCPRL